VCVCGDFVFVRIHFYKKKRRMSRPVVSVYDPENADATVGTVTLPAVFTAPIRSDVVHYVHTLMAKNARQAYAVSLKAGHQTPAESWGTGRAVSRIPRVPGGGTSRSGQGAFGNMCRGGRMFGPTKIWRRWHRKISVNQRRYAVASALAATAVPALVAARGHRIDNVPELPLVISDSLNSVSKAKDAKAVLTRIGAAADVEKARDSKKIRRGVGKSRNRRYTQRRGPLIVYDVSEGIDRGFRNLPGVELTNVDNLNLLDLAPGGHLGRFLIWTKGAFEKLDSIFGTYDEAAKFKSGFNLPRSSMTNADLARIINSDEIQSIVRPTSAGTSVLPKKRNPLKNTAVRVALNPYHATVHARETAKNTGNKEAKSKALAARKASLKARSKEFRARRKAFYTAANTEGTVTF
jgi:large subunit ribosomal protein L4e